MNIEIHEQNELREIKEQLNELANFIVEENVDNLIYLFINKDVEKFYQKAEKSKKYKRWLIIKKFLEKIEKTNWDRNDKILIGMIDYIKTLI